MKTFFVVALALVVVSCLVHAAPFDTKMVQWTQPNGVTFIGRAWGDEFFCWAETQSGHRFIEGAGGWYYYATLNQEGEFAPTTLRVGIDTPPTSSYKLERTSARIAAINQSIVQVNAQRQASSQWFAQKQAAAQGAPVPLRIGVIFVEFQDVRHYRDTVNVPPVRPHGYLQADFDSMLFSSNGSWFDTTTFDGTPHPENNKIFGSFRDYWDQISRGQLIIQQAERINPVDPNGVPRWLLLDSARAWYVGLLYRLRDEAKQKAIDSMWLDTTRYDKYIYIFAQNPPAGVNFTHGGDGTFIQVPERLGFQLMGTQNVAFAHIGTYLHEFGHNLGFPDEYGGAYDLWNYCVMGMGIYNGPQRKGECPATLSPYYRIQKGWAKPIVLDRDTTGLVVRYNYQNPILYRLNPPGAVLNEHYLLETRLRQGFDLYVPTPPELFPQQPGTLLLWRHNVTNIFLVPNPNVVDQVRVKHADNLPDTVTFLTDFYPNNSTTNQQSLNDLTIPMASFGFEEHASFGLERPAHFALNGIRRLADSSTVIDTIVINRAMVANSLTGGWNLLSVPVGLNNYATSAVFPTAISSAFGYVPGLGYVQVDSIKKGAGYFIKFGPAHQIVHAGLLVDSLRIPVAQEWNLLGSISDAVPTSRVCPDPPNIVVSPFYRYAGEKGYVPSDSLKPGAGYWVRVSQNGSLTLKRSLTPCVVPIAIDVAEMDRFTITDSQGREQDLYVANVERDPSLEQIDLSMPPPFPEAEFDARFGTGDFVETVSPDSGVVELVISVETQAYPVTVTWELNPENGIEYSLITEGMEKQQTSGRLVQSGSAAMTAISGGKFRMSARATGRSSNGNLPTQYSLAQNYPNPFNPETRIQFELPQDSPVRLVVYDLLGREVATLVDESRKAGRYDVTFGGRNLASGVYFYRLQAGTFNDVKKLLLLR